MGSVNGLVVSLLWEKRERKPRKDVKPKQRKDVVVVLYKYISVCCAETTEETKPKQEPPVRVNEAVGVIKNYLQDKRERGCHPNGRFSLYLERVRIERGQLAYILLII